jgi:hypothetical protein
VIGARTEQQNMQRQELALRQQEEARQKLLSEAQMREMQQQGMEREMGHLAAGTKDTDIQDPELRKYVTQTGGFRMAPESPEEPAVTGDTVQGASMSNVFAGTPKEQAEEAARGRIEQIAQQYQNATDPAQRDALELQLVKEGIDPRQVVRRVQPSAVNVLTGRTQTFQNLPAVPEGDAVHFYQPAQGESGGPKFVNYQWRDKSGGVHTAGMTTAQRATFYKDHPEAEPDSVIQTGLLSLNPKQNLPSPAETNKLTAAQTQLASAINATGFFGGKKFDQKGLEPYIQQVRSALAPIFAKSGKDTQLQELAAEIASDPQLKDLPVEEALKHFQIENPPASMVEDVSFLLNYARGAGGFMIAPDATPVPTQ